MGVGAQLAYRVQHGTSEAQSSPAADPGLIPARLLRVLPSLSHSFLSISLNHKA